MTVTLEEIKALGLAEDVERMRGHAPDPIMLSEEEKKRKNNEACKAYYRRHREELNAQRRAKYAQEKQANSKKYRRLLARGRANAKLNHEHRLQVMREYRKRQRENGNGNQQRGEE